MLIYHRKCSKLSSKHKWTQREYHVQEIKDIQHKQVKFSCDSTQL